MCTMCGTESYGGRVKMHTPYLKDLVNAVTDHTYRVILSPAITPETLDYLQNNFEQELNNLGKN